MKNCSTKMMWMKHSLNKTCYQFFSTLANPTRLAILEFLRNSPKNVTEIAEALNQEQSMISHNLRSLEKCRLVFSERRKKERLYSLNKETMEPMFKIFTYHSEKYCPTRGKCLTDRGLRELRKRDASTPSYVTHQ
jgi:DNA-binding transcriptional ArsR family regulator